MSPTRILWLENTVTAILSLIAYIALGGPWWLLAVLFLAPDVAMLGYLMGPRVGANAYNLVHTSVLPLALMAVGLGLNAPTATWIGLIWLFHIAMDRALGYGLKLPTGFQDTHLGRIGRIAHQ